MSTDCPVAIEEEEGSYSRGLPLEQAVEEQDVEAIHLFGVSVNVDDRSAIARDERTRSDEPVSTCKENCWDAFPTVTGIV